MRIIYHDVLKEAVSSKKKKKKPRKQECVDSYEAGPLGVIYGPTVTVMCSAGAIKRGF